MCVVVRLIKSHKLYEFKYMVWMTVLASFLRVCLIFTYYFDQTAPGKYAVVDEVQMYLIIIYLFNWIISTIIAYFMLVFNLGKYLIEKAKIISRAYNLSTIHLVPSLSKYRNLARK